jgi:hypothetical protein
MFLNVIRKLFISGLLDFADPLKCKNFWIGLKLEHSNYDNNYVSNCQYTDGTDAEQCPIYEGTRGQYPWARYEGYPPEPNNWAKQEECVVIGHNTGVTQVLQTVCLLWYKIK